MKHSLPIHDSMWSTNKVAVVVNPTPSPPTSGKKKKKNKQWKAMGEEKVALFVFLTAVSVYKIEGVRRLSAV